MRVQISTKLISSDALNYISLRKKCPYSELFWSVFSRIRTEYGEVRSIFFKFHFEIEFISHVGLNIDKKTLKNSSKIITNWYNFLSNPRIITSSILSQVTM